MKNKKPDNIKNNPVAKHAPEFCKPKTFRNRKTHPTAQDEKRQHEHAVPYKRVPIEDEIDYDDYSYDSEFDS